MSRLRFGNPLVPEHSRHYLLYRAFAMLVLVTLAGTLGFMLIEGWAFWRSFFFTMITITTVGYGDGGISDGGQKFATLLVVLGIGTASWTFGLLVQSLGQQDDALRRRMKTIISRMSDHVIVCGFGGMGRRVCEELHRSDIPFVIVDIDDARIRAAIEKGWTAIHGSGSEDEVLVRAGIGRARHLVSAVCSREENIVITLCARELSPDLPIIARAECESDERKLRRAGATRTVAPLKVGGTEIAHAIIRPEVSAFLARSAEAESGVILGAVTVDAGSSLVGMTLADLGRTRARRTSFVALDRPGETLLLPPPGGATLAEGDTLIVAGDPDEIVAMNRRAHAEEPALPPA